MYVNTCFDVFLRILYPFVTKFTSGIFSILDWKVVIISKFIFELSVKDDLTPLILTKLLAHVIII